MTDTPPATTPPAKPPKEKAPETALMPRTVHEIAIGPKPEDVIEPKTFLTETVMKENKLDAKAVTRLVASGAVELVEVHKG